MYIHTYIQPFVHYSDLVFEVPSTLNTAGSQVIEVAEDSRRKIDAGVVAAFTGVYNDGCGRGIAEVDRDGLATVRVHASFAVVGLRSHEEMGECNDGLGGCVVPSTGSEAGLVPGDIS